MRLLRMTIAAASAVLVIAEYAQPQETPPTFEVASIKRDVSGQPGPLYRMFPGFTVQRATLKDLVTIAYGEHDFQVSGGPGWIASDRYNIEAKAEADPVFSRKYRTLQLQRLQTLLRDRFRLVVHHETRELPVYELTVAKGGPKLQPPSCIEREPGDLFAPPAPGKTMMDYCGFGGFSGRGRYQASNGSMADMAGALSLPLDRIVFDKTGIRGRFRLELTFARDTAVALPAVADPGAPELTADLGPDIFTALQEQLGLKLESGKGPVDVLVIDHVEKPSQN